MPIRLYPDEYQKALVIATMWAVLCTGFLLIPFVISLRKRLRNDSSEPSADSSEDPTPPKNNIGLIIFIVIISIVIVIAIIFGLYLLINKKSIILDYN